MNYKNPPTRKAKILPEKLVDTFYPEDDLFDYSIIESIYQIRQLKACIKSMQDGFILVEYPINEYDQCFSKEFEIGFLKQAFEILPD